MSMEPWDPFGHSLTLREAMDRLLQDSFIRPSGWLRGMSAGSLALDVHEDENSYTIRASLPGIKPEDVHVQVVGDTITIRGETHEEREQKDGGRVILHERQSGSFNRTLTLPMPIDSDHAGANFENGVLVLTLPKEPRARPRRIHIRGATTGQDQVMVESESQSPSPSGSMTMPPPDAEESGQAETTVH